MATLSDAELIDLLRPYAEVSGQLAGQLSSYLDLLVKWNARTNLTAIRDPREMVRRHFGESLFMARHLPAAGDTLLDFGSGAGFPGLPIQMWRPELKVTLAESQNKKASFLREVIRTLGLGCEVWDKRVEEMPEGRRFDLVVMRAVDRPEVALIEGARRTRVGGTLGLLSGEILSGSLTFRVPGTENSFLSLQSV